MSETNLLKDRIADLTPDTSHDVVKQLVRDICTAAHSTDESGEALVARSEVEMLLERIARMRRTTKTAIKDEYEDIERAEYLLDGENFQLPEGAHEQGCAPGFFFQPADEEEHVERAVAGQPRSRGSIWRMPNGTVPFPTRICDALFTRARVVLPGSLGPALVLDAPQADGTTNSMLLLESEIIRDPRVALARINYELNVKHYTSVVERAIAAVYPNDAAPAGRYVERHGWTDAACTHFALTGTVLGPTGRSYHLTRQRS